MELNKKRIITICLSIAVIIALILIVINITKSKIPEEEYKENDFNYYHNEYIVSSVNLFFERITNRDYEKAYNMLSDDFKDAEMQTLEKFKSYCEKKYVTTNGVRDVVFYEDQKVANYVYSVRTELSSSVDNSVFTEYFTVNFLSGEENPDNFSLAMKEFIRTDYVENAKSTEHNVNISIDKIERYRNSAKVYATVKNDNNRACDLLSEDIVEFENGNPGITCLCGKDGQTATFNLITKKVEDIENAYEIPAHDEKKVEIVFNIPIDVEMKKITFSGVMLGGIDLTNMEINL